MATAGIYCRKCNYDLQGQVGAAAQRCPECGRGFDAGDGRTFCERPLRGVWVRWMRRVVGLLVVAVILGASWGWLYWGWRSEQNAVEKLRPTDVNWEPLGGWRMQGYLGPMGWVLDRVKVIHLPQWADNADLAYLSDLKGLRELNLEWTQVTDEGLEKLKDLTGLERLNLDDTRVTDAGMEHLKYLKGLRDLDIAGTPVFDAGLVHLKELKGLKKLGLWRTRVTLAGLKDLQEALPHCHIEQ